MIYDYRCRLCAEITSVRRHVAERDVPVDCTDCGGPTLRILSAVACICNSDSFPTQALRGDAFWRPDGRNLYMKERDYLDREAADDAAAAPDTCLNVARRGESGKLAEAALGT